MLQRFLPDVYVRTIYEIDLDDLQKQGCKAIITDLDNTLVGAKEPLATPELILWLKRVEEMGFRVSILSNNQQARVTDFAKPLSLPYIYSARKPGLWSFRKAMRELGVGPKETVMIGDQMLTDILGGNRLGLTTILVRPISLNDESFFTRINRRIEKRIIARLKKQGHIAWEDE